MTRGLALLALLAVFWPSTAHADVTGFPKWNGVVAREHVASTDPFPGDLKPLLDRVQAEYRHIPYVSDQQNYGEVDYWATRAELLANGGDCEDFATAEFFDLVEAGVPESELWVTIVLDRKTQEVHAVLVAGEWVLDRRASRVLSSSEADAFYLPVYGINRTGWTAGPGLGTIASGADR